MFATNWHEKSWMGISSGRQQKMQTFASASSGAAFFSGGAAAFAIMQTPRLLPQSGGVVCRDYHRVVYRDTPRTLSRFLPRLPPRCVPRSSPHYVRKLLLDSDASFAKRLDELIFDHGMPRPCTEKTFGWIGSLLLKEIRKPFLIRGFSDRSHGFSGSVVNEAVLFFPPRNDVWKGALGRLNFTFPTGTFLFFPGHPVLFVPCNEASADFPEPP